VVALVVALGLVMAFEYVGGFIFQHPALDMKDPKTVSNMMASMPIAAFLWILLGHIVSSYIGGLVATFISGRNSMNPALIVGSALLVGGIMNLIMIPYHPLWFMIADVLVYLPFAWLGYIMAKKKIPA
jgi:hypothetical protein